MLPELRQSAASEQNELVNEYSSVDEVLDLPSTITLLNKHRLMIDDVGHGNDTEMLR
jgi:hypothetical protein